MADEPLPRSEFNGYVQRHDADEYAHAAMRHSVRNELISPILAQGSRITNLEMWQQRIVGAVTMLSLLVLSGLFGVVVSFLHK